MMKMLQVNLLMITSLCCLSSFNNFAQCSTRTGDNKEALITNISQHIRHPIEDRMSKKRVPIARVNYGNALKKGLISSHYDRISIDPYYKADKTTTHIMNPFNAPPKNSHTLNKKMLRKLGFTKVKAPNSHHRKRLAVESRRHTSPDDSHMFIIKLPPNFIYYTNPKGEMKSNTEMKMTNPEKASVSTFPFNSNGKPGRIYHWNLPVLQKILEKKKLLSHSDGSGKKYVLHLKNIPNHWENDINEKSYKSNYKKSLKYKSPSYYAPTAAVNKNSFNRYFSGNGKPKGFYVMKDSQKKDMYYKDIVP